MKSQRDVILDEVQGFPQVQDRIVTIGIPPVGASKQGRERWATIHDDATQTVITFYRGWNTSGQATLTGCLRQNAHTFAVAHLNAG